MCLRRVSERAVAKSHTLHVNCFSCEWVIRCDRSAVDVVYRFPQCTHEYGFSPVCDRRCSTRWLERRNLLSQYEQAYCFSDEWVRTWFFIVLMLVNRRLQCGHENGRSPVKYITTRAVWMCPSTRLLVPAEYSFHRSTRPKLNYKFSLTAKAHIFQLLYRTGDLKCITKIHKISGFGNNKILVFLSNTITNNYRNTSLLFQQHFSPKITKIS